jgi:hypothetical protein
MNSESNIARGKKETEKRGREKDAKEKRKKQEGRGK